MLKRVLVFVGMTGQVLLTGCFGGSEEKARPKVKDLDISGSTPGQGAASDEETSVGEKDENPGPVDKKGLAASAKDEWKQFFKPPPTVLQRSLLEKSVRRSGSQESPEKRLDYARKQMALGHLGEAEKAYREVIRSNPGRLEASLELSMIMIRKRRANEAFRILEEIRYQFSKRKESSTGFIFQYRYTLALAFLLINDRTKCHEILTDLIETDKTFSPGYAALASSYFSTGKTGVAEFVVQRGMERSKEDPTLYNLMGVIQQKKGHFDKAEYWYKKALDLRPEFAAAMTNQAILFIRKYDYEAAESLLKKSVALQPSFPETKIALGIVYMHQKKTQDAKQVLSKVLELYPQNTWARYNLGILTLYGMNKPFKAMQLFQEAVQTSGPGEDEVKWSAENYISDIRNSQKVR